MPLPTRSACSALASPGGQISMAGGVAVVLAAAVPVVVVGAPAEGSTAERSRLGGVVSVMMFADGLDIGNAASGATLPPVLDWEVEVVDVAVEPVALALGGLTGVLAPGDEAALGNGIAPDVATGEVPGGDGGGPVVVVATVDGEVDGVTAEDVDDGVEDVDCAIAGPASPTISADASASLPDAIAISAPA